MTAILKSKMAAGYHGDSDGYLALFESPYLKVPMYQISCFCPEVHNWYARWLLGAVLLGERYIFSTSPIS